MASTVPDLQFSQIRNAASEASRSFTGDKLTRMRKFISEIEDVIVKKDSKRYKQLLKSITSLQGVLKGSLGTSKVKRLNDLVSHLETGLKWRNSRGIDLFGFIKMPDGMQVQGQPALGSRERSRTSSAGTDKKEIVCIQAELEKLERELQQKHNDLFDQEPPTCVHDENDTLSTISNIKSLSRSFTDRIEKMGPKAGVAGLKEKMAHETFETIINWLTILKSEIASDVYNENKYSLRAAPKFPDLEKNRDIIVEIVTILSDRRERKQRNEKEREAVLQQLSELEKEVDATKYQKKLHLQTPNEELPKRIKDVREKLNVQWQKLAESKEVNEKKKTEDNALNSQILQLWNNVQSESEKPQKRALPPVPATALKEIEQVLQEQKAMIHRSENIQNAIQTEIQCLKTDIGSWDSMKMTCSVVRIDKQTSKIVHDIREIRNLLMAEKKKQVSENEKRKSAKQQPSSQIRKLAKLLWNVAFGETQVADTDDGRGGDVEQMLKEVTSELESWHRLQKNLEDEIQCLHKETENLDCSVAKSVVTVNEKSPEMLKSLRQIRNNVQQRKNDIIEQKQVKEKKEKQTQCSIVELWKTVFEITDAIAQQASSDSRTLLEQMKTQLSKLKDERQDVQIFLDESNQVLLEIQSIVINEPFFFTEPRRLDREAVIKNTSYRDLHPIKIGITWIKQCMRENSKSFQKNFIKMEIYDSLKAKQKELLDVVDKLKVEKDDALNRLSKIAGARLTDNNPNIADLSDPNRPTRLAEQYSELYDSPWTDAFETLKTDEKDRINFLLKILVECYTICGEISVNHQKIFKRVLCNPTEGIGSAHKATKQKDKENSSTLSAVQSKALSELRKQGADLSVISVKAHIQTENQEWFKTKKLQTYTFLCIELCWLMHVQSPPVFLETSIKAGSPFDTSKYKQYTKAGKKIDYLVWPALFLQEGGAMLSKGVAQGK